MLRYNPVWTPLALLCLLLTAPSSASADFCGCGSVITAFDPFTPYALLSKAENRVIIELQGSPMGTKTIHHCECMIGQGSTPSRCSYYIEEVYVEGGDSTVDEGDRQHGCEWRNMDQELWCMDTGCSDSGDPEDPIPIAPHQ